MQQFRVTHWRLSNFLYSLNDPGSDPDNDVSTLYEELLLADPSGMGGRPRSLSP
jgi:hypothetical protein